MFSNIVVRQNLSAPAQEHQEGFREGKSVQRETTTVLYSTYLSLFLYFRPQSVNNKAKVLGLLDLWAQQLSCTLRPTHAFILFDETSMLRNSGYSRDNKGQVFKVQQ